VTKNEVVEFGFAVSLEIVSRKHAGGRESRLTRGGVGCHLVFEGKRIGRGLRIRLLASAFLGGGGGGFDDVFEDLGQPLRGFARVRRELGHLGEAQLRVGEREPFLGFGDGGAEPVVFPFAFHLNSAPFEQVEFAVIGPKTDGELVEQGVA